MLAACSRPDARPTSDSAAAPPAADSTAPSAAAAPNDSLDRTIAGIRQTASDSAVRAIAGQPDSASAPAFSEMIGDTVQTLFYPQLTIELVARKVDGVSCARTDCATARGVRVGDPATNVTRAYGAGERSRGDTGESIVYRDANNCGMAFDLTTDSHVREIHVFCDHS